MTTLTDQQMQSAFKGFLKLCQDERVVIPITYSRDVANLSDIAVALLNGQVMISPTPEGVGKDATGGNNNDKKD